MQKNLYVPTADFPQSDSELHTFFLQCLNDETFATINIRVQIRAKPPLKQLVFVRGYIYPRTVHNVFS